MSPSRRDATKSPQRRLRRDAELNRERLLQAAAQVFTDHGLDAGVEEIAAQAGVGMGTLYRRFPTKDALVAALVEDALDAMLELAVRAAEEPDGLGLERFLERAGAYQAEHVGCLPRLWNTPTEHAAIPRVRRIIAKLVEDAKAHGRVRSDLTATDLTMVLWSIRGVIETTHAVSPGAWRRHLDLLLAGLRPADEPLRHRPVTRADVDRIISPTT